MIAFLSTTPLASHSTSTLITFALFVRRALGHPDRLATVLLAPFRDRETWMAFLEACISTVCPSQRCLVETGYNGRPGRCLNSLLDHSLGAGLFTTEWIALDL